MTAPTGATIGISDLTVNGVNLGDITMRFGEDGVTQFDDAGGKTTVRQLTQNGLPAGNFESVSITDGGRVVAQYSNGKTIDLYQIPLVEFKGQTGLAPLDGGRLHRNEGKRAADQQLVGHGRRRLAGGLQRRHRRGVHQADRHPAGVLGQFARHHHRRPDDERRHQHHPLTDGAAPDGPAPVGTAKDS